MQQEDAPMAMPVVVMVPMHLLRVPRIMRMAFCHLAAMFRMATHTRQLQRSASHNHRQQQQDYHHHDAGQSSHSGDI
jgi:hypothetical protein